MGKSSKRRSHTLFTPANTVPIDKRAIEYITQGKYQELLDRIQNWQKVESQNRDNRYAGRLGIITRICQLCIQLQKSANLHREIYEDVIAHEKALQNQLLELVQSAINDHAQDVKAVQASNLMPETQPISHELRLINWIERLRNLFERKNIKEYSNEPSVSTLDQTKLDSKTQEQAETPNDDILTKPTLTTYTLGSFRVYNNEQLIEKWPGNKCKSIFKYMIVHRNRPIPLEILMDLFWRDQEPESARRNLYQSIYLLRQALQSDLSPFGYIISENGCYGLNPDIQIWLDSEEFSIQYEFGKRFKEKGDMKQTLKAYEQAIALYEGKFLDDDPYEDWPVPLRETIQQAYVEMLEFLSHYHFFQNNWAMSIAYCQKLVQFDDCNEVAHQMLMKAYFYLGQRYLAIRQYFTCVKALQALNVTPMPETENLYFQIQKNQVQ